MFGSPRLLANAKPKTSRYNRGLVTASLVGANVVGLVPAVYGAPSMFCAASRMTGGPPSRICAMRAALIPGGPIGAAGTAADSVGATRSNPSPEGRVAAEGGRVG